MAALSGVAVIPIVPPTQFFSRGQCLQRSSPVPISSGFCFWYFRSIPSVVPTDDCLTLNGCTLLYLGVAPDRASITNATLSNCVVRNYRGNVQGSSLRKTLGILLEGSSGFPLLRAGSAEGTTLTLAGERWLDDWMEENVFVGWTEHPKPWCCTARNMSVIVFQKFPNLLGFRFRNPASNVRNTVRNTSAIVRDP
jgi:hypothetical protein